MVSLSRARREPYYTLAGQSDLSMDLSIEGMLHTLSGAGSRLRAPAPPYPQSSAWRAGNRAVAGGAGCCPLVRWRNGTGTEKDDYTDVVTSRGKPTFGGMGDMFWRRNLGSGGNCVEFPTAGTPFLLLSLPYRLGAWSRYRWCPDAACGTLRVMMNRHAFQSIQRCWAIILYNYVRTDF